MAERHNPARSATGGVRCFASRLNTPEHSRNRRALQCSARIDELLWRLGDALRLGRLEGWGRDFAKSILGQAKRGRRWSPSGKQLHTMRRLLVEQAEAEATLIDDADITEFVGR